MESKLYHTPEFSSNYELQQYRSNYPYLKKMGSRRRHSTYGMSLVELENLAINCIKTRISLNEYPDPVVVCQDVLATIGVLSFSMVNCFDLESGDCYSVEHNAALKSHKKLLTEIVQIVESYVICHQVTTIYELEKFICYRKEVDDFQQLGIGPLHLLPPVVYHFRYLSAEFPYNVTLKSVVLGLNEFLSVLDSTRENIQNKPNLCVEFVEFFITHHNYSQPDRLGLIIANIDAFIQNWKAVTSTQLNLVDKVVVDLKQKFLRSITNELQQSFNTLSPFTPDGSTKLAELFQNVPLFTLVENTIQFVNCVNNSTHLTYLPNDIKQHEKCVKQLFVQHTAKIKHSVDRQFLSDVIVMGSFISIVSSAQRAPRNWADNDCGAVIDVVVDYLVNLKSKLAPSSVMEPLTTNYKNHTNSFCVSGFMGLLLNNLKMSFKTTSHSTVVTVDYFLRTLVEAMKNTLINNFNVSIDTVGDEQLRQSVDELVKVSPLLVVNNLSRETAFNSLSTFVSRMVDSLNRQISGHLKYNTKEEAIQYVAKNFNIDQTILHIIHDRTRVNENVHNSSFAVITLSHFFEGFRSEHSHVVDSRLKKFYNRMFIWDSGYCVFDAPISSLPLHEMSSAVMKKFAFQLDESVQTNELLLVEQVDHCWVCLKRVSSVELGELLGDCFRNQDPFKCARLLYEFVISCCEFWHQVPTTLITRCVADAINTVSVDFTVTRQFLIEVLAYLPSKVNTFLYASVFVKILGEMFDQLDSEDILKFAFSHVKSCFGRDYCVKFAVMAIECLAEDVDYFVDFSATKVEALCVPNDVDSSTLNRDFNNHEFVAVVEGNCEVSAKNECYMRATDVDPSLSSNLIDHIRRNKFGIVGSIDQIDPILKTQLDRQGRGLMKLASELYSNKSHFLFELIQNFDDSFSKLNSNPERVVPSCAFILTKSDLYATSNETGFDASDVEAICDVGSSTKCESKTTIGCKGIGFKSVFSVSNKPEIHSGGFNFKFDADHYGPIGYILPENCAQLNDDISNYLKKVLPFNTCVRLPLKATFRSFKLSIDNFTSVLLFLRHIQCIVVLQHDSLINYSKVQGDSHFALITTTRTNLTTTSIEETSSQRFFTLNNKISTNDDDCNVSISFRIPAIYDSNKNKACHREIDDQVSNLDELMDYQPQHEFLYCFLPVRSYGFKFIIQANFELSSSREEVVLDSAHNMDIFSKIPALFIKACQSFISQQNSLTWSSQLMNFVLLLKLIPNKNSFLQPELFFVRRMILDGLRSCEIVPCIDLHSNSIIVTSPSSVVVVYEREWFAKLGKFFNQENDCYIGASIAEICHSNQLHLLHPRLNNSGHSSAQCIRDTLAQLGCHFFGLKMIVRHSLLTMENNNCMAVFALLIDLLELGLLSPHICSDIQNDGSKLLSDELKSLKFILLQHNQVTSLSDLSTTVYYTSMCDQTKNSENESIQSLCKLFLECSRKLTPNNPTTNAFALLHVSIIQDLLKNNYRQDQIDYLLSTVFNFKSVDIKIVLKEHILPLLNNALENNHKTQLYIKTTEYLYNMWKESGFTTQFLSFIKECYSIVCLDHNKNFNFIRLSSKIHAFGLYQKLPLADHYYVDLQYYSNNFENVDNFDAFFEYLGVEPHYQSESLSNFTHIIKHGPTEDRVKLLKYLDEFWQTIKQFSNNECSKVSEFECQLRSELWIVNKDNSLSSNEFIIACNKCPTSLDHPSFHQFISKVPLSDKEFLRSVGVTTKLTVDFCLNILGELAHVNYRELPPLSVFTVIYTALAKQCQKKEIPLEIDRHKKLIYVPQCDSTTLASSLTTIGHMYSSNQVCYTDKIFCSEKSLKRFYPHSDLRTLFVDHFNVDLSPRNYLHLLDSYLQNLHDDADVNEVSKKVLKFFKFYNEKDALLRYNHRDTFKNLYDDIVVSNNCETERILKTHSKIFSKMLNAPIDLKENTHHLIVDDRYLERYLQYFHSVNCVDLKTSYGQINMLSWKKFKKLYSKMFLLKLFGYKLLSNVVKIDCACYRKSKFYSNDSPIETHFHNVIDLIYKRISTLLSSTSNIPVPEHDDYVVNVVTFDDNNPFIHAQMNDQSANVNGRLCVLVGENLNCWCINSYKLNNDTIPKITAAQLEEFVMEFEKLFQTCVGKDNWIRMSIDIMSDFVKSSDVISQPSESSNIMNEKESTRNLKNMKKCELPQNFALENASKFTDHVGRAGEQFFYDFVMKETHFNKNQIIDVEWINMNDESFLPCINTTASHFVEVKSTSIENKTHFFLSLNELTFALDNNKNYFVCRVFVDVRDPENSHISATLGNIVDSVNCKDYKLILAY